MQRHRLPASSTGTIQFVLAILVLLTSIQVASSLAQTHEAYLVNGFYGGLGVFDMATGTQLANVNASSNNFSIAVGPNPRLAFISAGSYLSVVDLTIQREITRLPQITVSRFSAFTSDGRYLLLFDSTRQSLIMFDASTMRLYRRISLAQVFRTASTFEGGSIVVIGGKAYVTVKQPFASRPAIALVDLHTFTVRAIPVPGTAAAGFRTLPNAAATPDGKYLVMNQGSKLVFLNLRTNTVQLTTTLQGSISGIAITPNGSDPTNIYGYVVRRFSGNSFASVVDLRPASPTFGQLIAGTDVNLKIGSSIFSPSGLSINAAGTRLVVAGEHLNPNSPLPNALVMDTALMLTNPGAAIVQQATLSNGATVEGMTIAPVSTAAPSTAPVVTTVSANVTNDASTAIHVFGSNFSPGAQVRIGSMPPLPTTFVSSSDLLVTVPQNAPAAPNQDVIVTNPNPGMALALRNQSGLLAGGITITATSAFQPQYQMAVGLLAGGVQVLDLQQRSMIDLAPSDPVFYGITFNADGAELYGFSFGPPYWPEFSELIDWKLFDQSLQGTLTVANSISSTNQGLISSINPASGRPVIYSTTSTFTGQITDLQLVMVDSDPSSQTYNSVVQTFNAGINAQNDSFSVFSFGATPDGKYVYVNYLDGNSAAGMLAIFDIVNGGPATLMTMSSLGADDYQYSLRVAPDGRTLLLSEAYANGFGEEIKVFDIASNPKAPVGEGTIAASIARHPYAYLSPFQVAGNHLFGIESYSNSVIAFNFDPVHSNFSQLGSYAAPTGSYYNILTVSPDASLVYLPDSSNSAITVLDAVKLANGQPPLLTQLATGTWPWLVAMSPLMNGSSRFQEQSQADTANCCAEGRPSSPREPNYRPVDSHQDRLQ